MPRGPNPAGLQKAREPPWFIAQDSEPQSPNIYKYGRGSGVRNAKGPAFSFNSAMIVGATEFHEELSLSLLHLSSRTSQLQTLTSEDTLPWLSFSLQSRRHRTQTTLGDPAGRPFVFLNPHSRIFFLHKDLDFLEDDVCHSLSSGSLGSGGASNQNPVCRG